MKRENITKIKEILADLDEDLLSPKDWRFIYNTLDNMYELLESLGK